MLVLDVGLKQGNLASIFKRVILPYRLLIIDEFGYLPLKQEQANLLFQVIAKRYEKGSIILTSNLPFGQWHSSSIRCCCRFITPPVHVDIPTDNAVGEC